MTRYLAIVIFLMSTSVASALKSDVEKPVYIDADSVLFNKTEGLAVYEGNVSIVQGTLKLQLTVSKLMLPIMILKE